MALNHEANVSSARPSTPSELGWALQQREHPYLDGWLELINATFPISDASGTLGRDIGASVSVSDRPFSVMLVYGIVAWRDRRLAEE